MEERITQIVIGKITGIDLGRRVVTVKTTDQYPITHPLKYRDVLDVVVQKEKIGNRVKVTTVKEPGDGEFYIKEIAFDEAFKKNAYTDTMQVKADLLGRCMVAAAMVIPHPTSQNPEKDFDPTMDRVVARAIKDMKTLYAEAKKP